MDKLSKYVQVNFYITERQKRLLDEISKVEELNKSNLIRQLIERQWDSTRTEHHILEDIE